jgi:hypothetical protein
LGVLGAARWRTPRREREGVGERERGVPAGPGSRRGSRAASRLRRLPRLQVALVGLVGCRNVYLVA